MVKLNSYMNTTKAQLESPDIISEHRPYLGCSQLGHECDRYLFLSFRWAYTSTYPQRVQRIFNTGHEAEPKIIKDLERIGIKCYGDQTPMTTVNGHVQGHCDGMAINVPDAPKTEHLLEFKTLNQNSFKAMSSKGVKEYHPVYYGQLQLYMHHLKLSRALFICLNKNDSSYYIERVKYDKDDAKLLNRRALSIVLAEYIPTTTLSRTWYKCKWCNAKAICHEGAPLDMNCRTCVHSTPVEDAKWRCNKHEFNISTKMQRRGCINHIPLEL